MSRKKLRLLNEVLPAPERATLSSARERTLSRLAAMVALAAASSAALDACKTQESDSKQPDDHDASERGRDASSEPPADAVPSDGSVTLVVDASAVPASVDAGSDAGQKLLIPKRPKHTKPSYHVVDMLPDPALRMSPADDKSGR